MWPCWRNNRGLLYLMPTVVIFAPSNLFLQLPSPSIFNLKQSFSADVIQFVKATSRFWNLRSTCHLPPPILLEEWSKSIPGVQTTGILKTSSSWYQLIPTFPQVWFYLSHIKPIPTSHPFRRMIKFTFWRPNSYEFWTLATNIIAIIKRWPYMLDILVKKETTILLINTLGS